MQINDSEVISHLQNLLANCSKYVVSAQENNFIHQHGLENFIYQCVVSPQFKKLNISTQVEIKTRTAIHLCVSESLPLQFVLPFGGYKLWHLPVYCEVGWSEFFAIAFYSQYLAPILASYLPGAVFNFVTDDVIIQSMDEVPKSDIEKYFHSFHELLTAFAANFPSNLKFILLKEDSPVLTSHPANVSEQYITLARRWGKNKILVSCTPIPESVPLGSTPDSTTMFWSGTGVLEVRPAGLVNRIVSKNIWAEISALPHSEVSPKLTWLHNLSKILVYPEKFGVGRYHLP